MNQQRGDSWKLDMVSLEADADRARLPVAEPVRDEPKAAADGDQFSLRERCAIWFVSGVGLIVFTRGVVPRLGFYFADTIGFAMCAFAAVFFLAEQAPEYRRTLRSYLGIGALVLTCVYAATWSVKADASRELEMLREEFERDRLWR